MVALTTFNLFSSDPEAARQRIAERPNVSREVTYYKENIDSIKSIDDFMEDRRIYALAMQAYGLEEFTYARGFIRKLLEEGTDDDDALANKLTDPRYKLLAEDFNFKRYDAATTAFERVQSGVIDAFYNQSIEKAAGEQNNGARLAIYFQRKSEDITTAFSIIGDPALFQFVKTAFNLPDQMSFLSIEKQALMIEDRLNITDLKDPEFLANLTNQFLAIWDLNNPEAVVIPPLISQPFGQFGIPQDLLAATIDTKFSR